MAEQLYGVDADPAYNLHALDVRPTLLGLRERGVAVGIVSDIHFDIRPPLEAAARGGLAASYTLSFEVGVRKPDPLMFSHALASLGVDSERALMIGDRSRPDGAAVEQGITTLLLPP